jgi:hypothetical protein
MGYNDFLNDLLNEGKASKWAMIDDIVEKQDPRLEIIKDAKEIKSINIINEFSDDHLPCFEFEVKFDTGNTTMSMWWYDAKIIYQAEAGRESSLKQLLKDIKIALKEAESQFESDREYREAEKSNKDYKKVRAVVEEYGKKYADAFKMSNMLLVDPEDNIIEFNSAIDKIPPVNKVIPLVKYLSTANLQNEWKIIFNQYVGNGANFDKIKYIFNIDKNKWEKR